MRPTRRPTDRDAREISANRCASRPYEYMPPVARRAGRMAKVAHRELVHRVGAALGTLDPPPGMDDTGKP